MAKESTLEGTRCQGWSQKSNDSVRLTRSQAAAPEYKQEERKHKTDSKLKQDFSSRRGRYYLFSRLALYSSDVGFSFQSLCWQMCIYCFSFSQCITSYWWAPCQFHNAYQEMLKVQRRRCPGKSYMYYLATEHYNRFLRMKKKTAPIPSIFIAHHYSVRCHCSEELFCLPYNYFSQLWHCLTLNEQRHYLKHTYLPLLKAQRPRTEKTERTKEREDLRMFFPLSILVAPVR